MSSKDRNLVSATLRKGLRARQKWWGCGTVLAAMVMIAAILGVLIGLTSLLERSTMGGVIVIASLAVLAI